MCSAEMPLAKLSSQDLQGVHHGQQRINMAIFYKVGSSSASKRCRRTPPYELSESCTSLAALSTVYTVCHFPNSNFEVCLAACQLLLLTRLHSPKSVTCHIAAQPACALMCGDYRH